MPLLTAFDWTSLAQHVVDGLSFGMLIALIALGYTMVYGIVELINFAHGDLFMLGTFFALTVIVAFGLGGPGAVDAASVGKLVAVVALAAVGATAFCAGLNVAIDRVIYRPLRTAPKLAPLVSAIGVSFILMNVGLFWGGSQDVNVPNLVPDRDAVTDVREHYGLETVPKEERVEFTYKNLLRVGLTVPLLLVLTVFVKRTRLGKAMRATAQNPTAARLMGIDADRVISATFLIGGALAGVGAVVYALTVNTTNYQAGYQNGLYAFTAAVLGGIGSLPGAVLGGLVIGLVRDLGSAYVGERWSTALVFAILIVVLVFRPSGLLGSRAREKV